METNYVQIKDMRPGLKNINTIFIVLKFGHPTLTRESCEVRTFKVANQSAYINASVWDEAGVLLVPGDIVKLTKGHMSLWRNCLTLYTSKGGNFQKIGEFCMVFNEQLNMSEPNAVTAIQLPSGPPNNAPVNNATNNGACRIEPTPVTSQSVQNTTPVAIHNNIAAGSTKPATNTNRIGTSTSQDSRDSQKRPRGAIGAPHRAKQRTN